MTTNTMPIGAGTGTPVSSSTAQNIKVDQEFEALIPVLTADERSQLEANLVSDGCRDPLVLWGNTLIDGHNRFEICTRLGIPFQTVTKEFESRGHVIEWIIRNQFGRRNLSSYQRGVLALRLKPIFEARALARQQEGVNQYSSLSENSHEATPDIFTNEVRPVAQVETPKPTLRTDVAVASLANISSNTIRKIEKIEAAAPAEVKDALAAGDVSINLAAQFVELPSADQQDAISAIGDGGDTPQVMRDAVRYYRTTGTGENEWYTPGEYVDLAREVMGGIDLDPASCDEANEVVKADKYFTKEISGLAEKWSGRIWLNPPYSRDLMPAFIAKIKESYLDGEVDQAVILTHNNTDTTWFHSLAGIASSLCFSKKRIKFYRGDEAPASPTNGQAFFYLGSNVDRFNEVFAAIGFIVAPVKGASI